MHSLGTHTLARKPVTFPGKHALDRPTFPPSMDVESFNRFFFFLSPLKSRTLDATNREGSIVIQSERTGGAEGRLGSKRDMDTFLGGGLQLPL